MKKKWVGIVVTFQILFISNIFSQDNRVDTFFNTNNNSYELYFYKSDVLYKYLEIVNDSISRERIIDNSTVFETMYHGNGRIKEKLQEQIILLDGNELYGRINNRLVFNSNGDTTTFEKYSSTINLEQFKRDYFTYPQESISFFYNSSNVLIKRTRRTVQTKYPEDICSYGWQYEYFDDGTLKKKDYYESTTSKTILSFQLNYYGTPCTAFLSKSYLYYPNGKIANKTVFSAKKVECEKYDSTGKLVSRHQSDFSFHSENYNEWQKSTYFYGKGEKIELGPNDFTNIVNSKLLFYQKNDVSGNLILEKGFWENGNIQYEWNNKVLRLYSINGEYLTSLNENPRNISFDYPEKLIDLLPKISNGSSINKAQLKYYVVNDDTLTFYKGKLVEYKLKYKNIVKYRAFNYSTNIGKDDFMTIHKINEDFYEYWWYNNDTALYKKRELKEIKDGKLIYETTTFDYYGQNIESVEYRNYFNNTFYFKGSVYAGSDFYDSIVLKDNFIPEYKDEYWSLANTMQTYPIKWYRWNKNIGLVETTETFTLSKDSSQNIYKTQTVFLASGLKYLEEIRYADSIIQTKYSLSGKILQKEKFTNQMISNDSISFKQNTTNSNKIQLNIPLKNITSDYYSLSTDKSKRYFLYDNKFVYDSITKAILYINNQNMPKIEPGYLHSKISVDDKPFLISTDKKLKLLIKNIIYDFELDKQFEFDSVRYFLSYNDNFIWYADDHWKLKKMKFREFILEHKNISDSMNIIYSFRQKPNSENLIFDTKNNIIIDHSYSMVNIIYLNTDSIANFQTKESYSNIYKLIGDWLVCLNNKFETYNGVKYKNIITGKEDSISFSSLPKFHDFNSPYNERKIIYNGYEYLARQANEREFSVANDSLFLLTFSYDYFDDGSDVFAMVNHRNHRKFYLDFKKKKLIELKKKITQPNNSEYFDRLENLYKIKLKNIDFTDNIYQSWLGKTEVFINYYNENALKINLKDGSYYKIDSTSLNKIKTELKDTIKTELSNISLIDKDAIKRFVYRGYEPNNREISKYGDLKSVESGLYSNLLSNPTKKLVHPGSISYLKIHWNGNKINPDERIVAVSTINSQPIFYTPDNYYFSPGRAHQSLSYQVGLTVYPFEQFDMKYNRPDIILDRLGYADSSLVLAYHQAYLKRLKKMGFTEEMLKDDIHLPELKIKNFENIPLITDSTSINLNIDIEDTKYKLDRINIWINDVPIYGSNGVSIRERNIQKDNVHLKIPLALGKNKVQLSVLNQAGAESYKETFNIECKTGKKQPDLYLITIGGSSFKQNEFNLSYAAKDAYDLATLLSKSPVYKNVFKKVIINDSVTKENVLNLKSLLKNADINDHVVLFLADHGVLNANLDYYLATYDMDFENPEINGIAYDELESLLDGIKPLKKTLILDACHSGEIDQEEVELANNIEKSNGNVQFRAIGKKVNAKLGSTNTLELAKSLFTDLRKGTGATVISSAGGMEFAMESDKWKNGLFTYCLLNGITSKDADLNKDGEIWLSELQKYIQQEVKTLSNGAQQPTSRIENQMVDFRLW